MYNIACGLSTPIKSRTCQVRQRNPLEPLPAQHCALDVDDALRALDVGGARLSLDVDDALLSLDVDGARARDNPLASRCAHGEPGG